jgi:hypothetical protein
LHYECRRKEYFSGAEDLAKAVLAELSFDGLAIRYGQDRSLDISEAGTVD